MPRRARVALAAIALLVTGLLAGCSKPVPQVTVLSAKTTTQVTPQTYCFSTDPSTCRIGSHIAVIKARPTGTLLVDVPHEVAAQGWSVASAVLVSGGQFQSISGPQYAATVHNSHSVHVTVPQIAADSYYLIIRTTAGSKNGTWVAQVDFSSS